MGDYQQLEIQHRQLHETASKNALAQAEQMTAMTQSFEDLVKQLGQVFEYAKHLEKRIEQLELEQDGPDGES